MRAILAQVERWRAIADELRAAAQSLNHAAARDQLLQMADGYDRLADDMEDHEANRRATVPK
jgi:hypothetical protein